MCHKDIYVWLVVVIHVLPIASAQILVTHLAWKYGQWLKPIPKSCSSLFRVTFRSLLMGRRLCLGPTIIKSIWINLIFVRRYVWELQILEKVKQRIISGNVDLQRCKQWLPIHDIWLVLVRRFCNQTTTAIPNVDCFQYYINDNRILGLPRISKASPLPRNWFQCNWVCQSPQTGLYSCE